MVNDQTILSLTEILKDPKLNLPLRPIVSRCVAPTYFVEKAFVIFLKSILPVSEYVFESTADFMDKIKQYPLDANTVMESLDVISLFPSINMDEVISYMFSLIDCNFSLSDDIKTSLKAGLNLIVFSNIFICNGVIFRKIHGALMGSPVSSLIAEFSLRPSEKKIFSSFKQPPVCWLRYVDDVLSCRPILYLIYGVFFSVSID